MLIQTERLLIRPVEMADGAVLLNAMACPQVHQMHSYGFTSLEKVDSYIGVLLREYLSGKYRTFAMADKNTNRLLGLITLDIVEMFSRAELSYWIDKDYRNMGYTTEALKGVIEYCFGALSINRIQAMTSNPVSERVLEKSGMTYEGTLRQYFGMNDTYWDVKIFSILKSDRGTI